MLDKLDQADQAGSNSSEAKAKGQKGAVKEGGVPSGVNIMDYVFAKLSELIEKQEGKVRKLVDNLDENSTKQTM